MILRHLRMYMEFYHDDLKNGRGARKEGGHGVDLADNSSLLSHDTSGGASLAETIIAGSKIQGVRFDSDPSLVTGTITITHEDIPRFVPVCIKYDTGSDANFIPSTLLQDHGLLELIESLASDVEQSECVFFGLNQQEYPVKQVVTLHWSPSNSRKTRKSVFHIVDDMGYDLLLGNPFICENDVFGKPARSALPISFARKHHNAGKLRQTS